MSPKHFHVLNKYKSTILDLRKSPSFKISPSSRFSYCVLEANEFVGIVSPFLVHGDDVIEGLDLIIHYLKKVSQGQWDLDARLQRQQRADSLA